MLTDNGIPQLSSTTRIVVTVEDINDQVPEFDQKFYKVQIPVNAKPDQALFQVSFYFSLRKWTFQAYKTNSDGEPN